MPDMPGATTRRRLLLGAAGAAGVVLTASDHREKAPARATTSPRPTAPSSAPAKPSKPPRPVPVLKKPIKTLADYAKATGGPAFPSDAVALTIDDGPHPVWTPKILKLLDKYDVPALFCMIGNQVLGHEDVARQVARAGHQLANHTWSHPTELGGKKDGVAQKEIRKAQNKISKTTGYAPKVFRSPGGDWSQHLLHDVAKAGLLPLDWTNDPRDWTRPGTSTIEHRMLAADPGQILLCHDGGGDRSQTYQALSVVIPELKSRGLRFVAL
jgi:peptidoglycan-N-acetylglucosamine deacetylase